MLNHFNKIKMEKKSEFQDKETEKRSYYYKLQEMEIFKLGRQKTDKFYRYSWKLTNKGKQICNSNPNLKNLLKQGDIKEFYKKIKKLTK